MRRRGRFARLYRFRADVEEGTSGAAGLQELARAGAIRPPRREEGSAWIDDASRPYQSKLSPSFRFEVHFDYAVTRAVTLPDGHTGAAKKKFLVLAGVVAPRGSAGHSCVAQMDGSRVNSDLACLSDDHEAITELRALPPPSAVQACRLIDPPAGAWLEAVSAYEPEGAEHWFRSKRMPVPIAVHITRPGDIVLVLNTYEPAIWDFCNKIGTEETCRTQHRMSAVGGRSDSTRAWLWAVFDPHKTLAGRLVRS